MKNRRAPRQLLILSFVIAITMLAACNRKPTGQQVLQTMLEKYEQNMEGIKNYTVVREFNGMIQTFYYERHMVDGHPAYRVAGNPAFDRISGRSTASRSPYELIRSVASRAKLTGTESVDGHSTYVVTVDDLSGVDINIGEKFSPQSITYWIGKDQYLSRKMRIEGVITGGEEQRPFSITTTRNQYKEVEGMLHPFLITVSMKGMISNEQRAQAKKAMAKMRKNLDKLPPEQRKRMKSMMQSMGGMQAMRQGNFKMTIRIKELQVNAGPPNGQ